jgi:hypothetical protein
MPPKGQVSFTVFERTARWNSAAVFHNCPERDVRKGTRRFGMRYAPRQRRHRGLSVQLEIPRCYRPSISAIQSLVYEWLYCEVVDPIAHRSDQTGPTESECPRIDYFLAPYPADRAPAFYRHRSKRVSLGHAYWPFRFEVTTGRSPSRLGLGAVFYLDKATLGTELIPAINRFGRGSAAS